MNVIRKQHRAGLRCHTKREEQDGVNAPQPASHDRQDDEPVFAPLVLNPLMAWLAEQSGFKAPYLGGGSMGYLKTGTEANLSLTEMVQAGLEVRAASPLPMILDGACGWGDPMHMHHTIRMAEAAGFVAIEVEDQLLPKRAHHHIGIKHIIPLDLMLAKVRECLAAPRSRECLIIARTNAARSEGLDEALRHGEAMHKAGTDVPLVLPCKPDHIGIIAKRLPAPLMFMMSGARLTSSGLTMREWGDLGIPAVRRCQHPVHGQAPCIAGLLRGNGARRAGPADRFRYTRRTARGTRNDRAGGNAGDRETNSRALDVMTEGGIAARLNHTRKQRAMAGCARLSALIPP